MQDTQTCPKPCRLSIPSVNSVMLDKLRALGHLDVCQVALVEGEPCMGCHRLVAQRVGWQVVLPHHHLLVELFVVGHQRVRLRSPRPVHVQQQDSYYC